MNTLYNYSFQFKDADDLLYKLRLEEQSGIKFLYRQAGTTDSYTTTYDFNIDEETNTLWVRLPAMGSAEVCIYVTVAPLQNITTGAQTIELVDYTTSFTMTATPVPLNSLNGFSPRVIGGYWYQFEDTTQTFVNTGIKAEAGALPEGTTVVDVVEPNNPNPVTSNAVYVTVNEIDARVTNISTEVNNIDSRVSTLESNPVKVELNGEIHEQDSTGLIDLGEVNSGLPDTEMLTKETNIDGTLYPKGTQIDSNNKVYSTDALYRYQVSSASSSGSYMGIAIVNFGCQIDVSYQIYDINIFGSIYCVKNSSYKWSFYTTSKEIAQQFWFYQYASTASPILCCSATSEYMPGTVHLTSNKSLSIYNKAFTPSSSTALKSIVPFITEAQKDTITIDTNTYSTSDLSITDYIVDVDGTVNFNVEGGISGAVSLEFSITQDNTVINVTDGTINTSSETLSAGSIATLVYNGQDNYYWNYSEPQPTDVTNVKVDNISVVVDGTAYINSFTAEQVNTIKALFS